VTELFHAWYEEAAATLYDTSTRDPHVADARRLADAAAT